MAQNTVKNVKNQRRIGRSGTFARDMSRSKYLYLLFLPTIVYFFVFAYMPLYGLLIAFKDYNPYQGIWGSPWAGLRHIRDFLHSVYFWRLIYNTITINIYDLLVGFPLPVILALMINSVKNNFMKRSVQTIVYLPHFISVIVVSGMLVSFLSPSSGIINYLIKTLGGKAVHFLAEPGWFKSIYVLSGVWQNAGWNSIIYIAALAGIDAQLYESATIDGANNWKQLIYITIPGILPTIIIMLILRIGSLFSVGFEKIILLYNPLTYKTADVISTYVYRRGIQDADFSYSTAIGLFNSLINFAMLVLFNQFSRKISETSLW
ncbi:ABC transporter permease subunit [Eubacteriales bacterium mix99]|jgi:putative aldouronate transport system permease protein